MMVKSQESGDYSQQSQSPHRMQSVIESKRSVLGGRKH